MRTYVFPGEVEFLKVLPALTVTAPSFQIDFQLQQDALDAPTVLLDQAGVVVDRPDGRMRTMVVLRFTPRDPTAEDLELRLFVRGHWPDRTDQFPGVGSLRARQLRKAFSLRRQLAEKRRSLAERLQQLEDRLHQLSERRRQLAERRRPKVKRRRPLVERQRRLLQRQRQLVERRRQLAERLRQLGQDIDWAIPSDDIYLMETTPANDLTAQLCLFVLQTELSKDSAPLPWLLDYITRTFKISVKQTSKAARDEERAEIALEVVTRLIAYKWGMEDARAWRRYVSQHLRAVERKHRSSTSHLELPNQLSDRATEDSVIASIDGGSDETTRPGLLPVPGKRSQPLDRTKETFSVHEAAQYLGVSSRTVYSHIHTQQLPVQPGRGPFVIAKAALDRVMAKPTLHDVIDAVAAARHCTPETARRQVHRLRRRGLTLDQILADAKIHQKNFDEAGCTRETPTPGHPRGQCTATSAPRLRRRNQP
jgi:excisionase family DNA binding protein